MGKVDEYATFETAGAPLPNDRVQAPCEGLERNVVGMWSVAGTSLKIGCLVQIGVWPEWWLATGMKVKME